MSFIWIVLWYTSVSSFKLNGRTLLWAKHSLEIDKHTTWENLDNLDFQFTF